MTVRRCHPVPHVALSSVAVLGALVPLAALAAGSTGCSNSSNGKGSGSGSSEGRVLEGEDLHVKGVTSDDAIVVLDLTAGEVKAVGLDGKVLATIAKGANPDAFVAGPVAFAWTDVNDGVGKLSVWSRASGAVAKGAGSLAQRAAVSASGSKLLYTVEGGGAGTVNVVLDNVAGNSPTVLVKGASAADRCGSAMQLVFAGTGEGQPVVSACPSGQATFTFQSFSAAGSPQATLTTGNASSALQADGSGTRAIFQTIAKASDGQGTLVSAALAGGTPTTLEASVGDAQWALSGDGASVTYRTMAGALKRAPVTGGAPTVLADKGVAYLGAVAPGGDEVLVASQATPAAAGTLYDALLIPGGGGALRSLWKDVNACLDCGASQFTATGSHVLFLSNYDGSAAGGTLQIVPTAGGEARSFGKVVSSAYALSPKGTPTSKVAIEQYSAADSSDLDVYVTDAATKDQPQLLGTRTNTGIFFAEKQTKLVYSYTATRKGAGVYVLPIP